MTRKFAKISTYKFPDLVSKVQIKKKAEVHKNVQVYSLRTPGLMESLSWKKDYLHSLNFTDGTKYNRYTLQNCTYAS